ncbi:MAG: choice-of-anchor B family protein [Flavobacteriales bacterium]|nr:choice-of-anchor B family protein [Flavobacteriales bacterium]
MLKKIIIGFIFVFLFQPSFSQLNMSKLGQLTFPGKGDLANLWGYVDEMGNEYAIVGMEEGVAVVDVTDPANPTQIYFATGVSTIWREVKVYQDKAYITNEGDDGLMIIDLSPLPGSNSLSFVNYTGNNFPFTTAHTVFIDENGYCYLFGSDNKSNPKNTIILDLNKPISDPNFEVGTYDDFYVHDGYVRGDTLWAAAINDGFFIVVDVSNKANPQTWVTQITPNVFTHNTWINDEGTTLFTTDEESNSFVTAYDVSDINNITELDRVQSNPGSMVIPHNTYFLNNYAITSYYRDGVTVHDVCDPTNMVEVGNYDTSPSMSGNGFNGCWGVFPYFPSGNIIASDIENGLFILDVNYTRAQKLEGIVTDSVTASPINGVLVNIVSTAINSNSNVIGEYQIGIAQTGTYDISFTKSGYESKTITGVSLNSLTCDPTLLNVQLKPLVPFQFQVNVIDAQTQNPVPNAQIKVYNSGYTNTVTANASGVYVFNNFTEATYTITAGKWGYITKCEQNILVNGANNTYTIELNQGYYDDFSFDFSWTRTGTATDGLWFRGEPSGTMLNSSQSNPEVDVTTDCNEEAYVTGNGGGSAGDDDVDGGETIITSPVFDLTSYSEPYVNYFRWFFNGGGSGAPNDRLLVKLDNGSTNVTIETVTLATPGVSSWVNKSFKISDYLTPTNNMRISVSVSDLNASPHVAEGGFDKFEITNGAVGDDEILTFQDFEIYPNPFSTFLTIKIPQQIKSSKLNIQIMDIAGKVVEQVNTMNQETIQLSNNYKNGVYFISISDNNKNYVVKKIVKL